MSSLFLLALAPPLVACVTASSSPPNDGSPEAGAPDATVEDSGQAEAGFVDSALVEAGAAESGSLDDGGFDASLSDATAPDASDASDAFPPPLFTIDAAVGCTPVGDQTALSPAAAGFPASGLALWLRADHGIYAMAGDASGLGVCAWLDLSGNDVVLAQTSASLPALLPAGIAGLPALQFSAPAQDLLTGSVLGIGATSGRTFIAVELLVAGDGRFSPVMQGVSGSTGVYLSIDANTFSTAGNLEGVVAPDNAYDTATATSTTQARVHVYTLSTFVSGTAVLSAIDYRVNGVTQTLTRRGGAGNGTLEDFSGANFTAVGVASPGTTGATANALVAEVMIYDRALSTTESVAVESALKARYAIP